MPERIPTIKAKFESGVLTVIQASPELELPLQKKPLTVALQMIGHTDWRVSKASFERFTLTATLERKPHPDEKPDLYLIHFVEETGDTLPVADKQFIEKTNEPIRQSGWQLLAISKPLQDLACGTCVISIWAKWN